MADKPYFKIGLNIGTLIAFLIMMGTVVMAGKALVEDYVSYRIQTNSNTIFLHQLQARVELLKSALPTQATKIEIRLNEIQKTQAVIETTVDSNHTRLVEIESDQAAIHKELKELDQRKLNGSAYWRGQAAITSRLEYLERTLK